MAYRPIYLVELVYPPTSDLGYTDASGLGSGGVWIDPNKDSKNYTWRVQWPSDITQDLVRFTNPEDTITNLDLELAALVFKEAVFGSISTPLACRTPTPGSNNTPIVVWTFHEASTINPVVANLLSIRSAHNRLHNIAPSIFYHPGPLNTMANGASLRFYLPPHPFLALF